MRRLERFMGHWEGAGVHHDGRAIEGDVEVRDILGGRAAQLSFGATGEEGEIVYAEESIIMTDPASGDLCMWSFNTTTGLTILPECALDGPHGEGDGTVQFSTDNLERMHEFRERITLKPAGAGRWAYCFEWGMPGEPMAARTSVVLSKVT